MSAKKPKTLDALAKSPAETDATVLSVAGTGWAFLDEGGIGSRDLLTVARKHNMPSDTILGIQFAMLIEDIVRNARRFNYEQVVWAAALLVRMGVDLERGTVRKYIAKFQKIYEGAGKGGANSWTPARREKLLQKNKRRDDRIIAIALQLLEEGTSSRFLAGKVAARLQTDQEHPIQCSEKTVLNILRAAGLLKPGKTKSSVEQMPS